ncbi:MAG: N-acetyl-gamma-glutamyl-phosphate reductase [Bacteroidetes bacterium OLB12]|nr:MAG: N-acetyl-gamma-glutamyl-phosphate reductase [Bacteroidetes bacterium OLB12]
MKLKAGIIGGAGYTGGETLRLLLNHPHVEVVFVQSRSQAGKPVTSTHHDLVGETDLIYSADFNQPVDVLFLCLSHGESKKLLSEHSFASTTRMIDLGNDFRLGDKAGDREFVYGLPEFQREKNQAGQKHCQPGLLCYGYSTWIAATCTSRLVNRGSYNRHNGLYRCRTKVARHYTLYLAH